MKSPATPIILIIGFLFLVINATIHSLLTLYPYLKRLTLALYSNAKAYLGALLEVTRDAAEHYGYYCLPGSDDGVVDTLAGLMLSDISRAIATFCRLGCRICE
jgi:hypothetical protein